MKLTKCEKKHFYDADKYSECPHCDKTSQAQVQTTPKTFKPSADVVVAPESDDTSTFSLHSNTETKSGKNKVAAGSEGEQASVNPLKPSTPPEAVKIPAVAGEGEVKPAEDYVPKPIVQKTAQLRPTPPSGEKSLHSQLRSVVSHEKVDEQRTVAFYGTENTHPVVGWLVCISGEHLGESFNLKAGQNFIGRALIMDVPLSKDASVSRNKHAIVTYDPVGRMFFVQPGESNGLTYVGKELLLTPRPISAYEHIKVGQCELVFVPFCGEKFAWEDYI